MNFVNWTLQNEDSDFAIILIGSSFSFITEALDLVTQAACHSNTAMKKLVRVSPLFQVDFLHWLDFILRFEFFNELSNDNKIVVLFS